jgi:hypothetical protein
MRMRLLAVVLLAVSCSGCLLSLQPIYTKADLVIEPALAGRWVEKTEPGNTWAFERTGDGYVLTIAEHGKRDRLTAHLTRLGGALFLDLLPAQRDIDTKVPDRFIDSHFVPAHSIWRVSVAGDSLKLRTVNEDWLDKRVKAGQFALAYSMVDWNNGRAPIVTGSTADVRNFLAGVANDDNVFTADTEGDFHRVR